MTLVTLWNCPHCHGGNYLSSATNEQIGICADCAFVFPQRDLQTDGSTWRAQAAMPQDDAPRWPVRQDRYRIIRPLATGAQGRIFLAHHLHLDQICVIKLLDAEEEWRELAAARLQLEARAGSLVNHAHVARVFDCDCVEERWYFVMEYVPGENLRRIVHAVGKLCWQQVVQLGAAIADGLEAIHQAGLIHRDLKPSNLLLDERGSPKITDLGLVKMTHLVADPQLTHHGQVLGTPYYMPPEQFDGSEHLAPQADIYALGATLYHLLAGKPPHQGAGVVELANCHRHEAVVWPDDISRSTPDWLRHTVEICLAKRPEHRFASARQLADTLQSGEEVTTLRPPTVPDTPRRGTLVTTFRNLSRNPDDDWLGDAIAEYLANRLMQIDDLHVVDRHQWQRLVNQRNPSGQPAPEQLASAARLLGAGTMICGAFQRRGDQLRITAYTQTDRPATGRVTAEASGTMDELFDLEDQIAASMIGALGGLPSPPGPHARGSQTSNLDAHQKFIHARRAFADGNYAAAIAGAHEALQLDATYLAAISLIGAASARTGDYGQALQYHEQEEALARSRGDHRHLAEALGNLGVMYYYQGDYDLAFDFLDQAGKLSRQLGQAPDAAKYDGNLGFVLLRLGRLAAAEQAFQRSIDTLRTYGDLVALAWPYNGMGGVLLKQERFAEAAEYYRRALGLAEEMGDRVNVGIGHMNLGRCACRLRDYAEAEAHFDEALDALQGTDFWNGLTLVYEHMADMYLQEGNTDQALDCITQRLALAEKHANRQMQSEAWAQRARAYELAGQQQRALHALKRSVEIKSHAASQESIHRHLSHLARRRPEVDPSSQPPAPGQSTGADRDDTDHREQNSNCVDS